MNKWLMALSGLLILEYGLNALIEYLNSKSFAPSPPQELMNAIDPEAYNKARRYHLEGYRFGQVRQTVLLVALLGFIGLGGFDSLDQFVRAKSFGSIVTGLCFVGALMALQWILGLPFSVYSTFVIEQKHGFNRTMPALFIGDQLKGILLSVVIGAPIFAGILWFFESTGSFGWLYAWTGLTIIQMLLMYLAPVLILPLFNQFKPLENEAIRDAVNAYASKEHFSLQGIYVMDGSKRSTKSNAFFTGFGRFRRLALFDTLISKQSIEQLVAVVAHEVGHFKCGHIPKNICLALGTSFVMFWTFSLLINHPVIFEAFGMSQISVYASLVFISILYSPLSRALSLFPNALSRKFEFEADAYSVKTYGNADALASALKGLSRDNLSHPSPHQLKVLMDYTHPPVLQRIRRINSIS